VNLRRSRLGSPWSGAGAGWTFSLSGQSMLLLTGSPVQSVGRTTELKWPGAGKCQPGPACSGWSCGSMNNNAHSQGEGLARLLDVTRPRDPEPFSCDNFTGWANL
jgi:hypothetical protein